MKTWCAAALLLAPCALAFARPAFAQAVPPMPPVALTTMTDNPAPSPAPPLAPPIVAQLEAATKDLQMPSETDAPFRVAFYPVLPPETAPAKAPETAPQNTKEPQKTPPTTETAPETETPAPTPETIAHLAGAPAAAKIELRDLDEFFANAVLVEDWMEDDEKATAQRFAALLETLKTALKNPQVVVWGDAQKQVAIIGQVEGGLAGVLTVVVET